MIGGVDWGTVPDWVAGIGTAGALIFTGLLFRHELNRASDERQAALQRETDREAEQAGAISSWIELDERTEMGSFWRVVVGNASTAAVYNCLVEATEYPDGEIESYAMATIPPGSPQSANLNPDRFRHVRTSPAINSQVRFTDAHGRHWLRNWYGELERLEHGVPSC